MITTEQLSQILSSAIRTGTERTLEHSGLIRNLVTKKEAHASLEEPMLIGGTKRNSSNPLVQQTMD